MMNIIGARRLTTIIIMVLANALLAAALFMWLIPQAEQADRRLQATKGQVSTARGETERMRNEIGEIVKQKSQFEQLEKTGFFTPQDRVMARQRIEAIQKYSRVLNATYDIQPAQVQRSDDLTAAGQVMLSSPVSVAVEAVDDLDFYNFVFLLQNAFPGQVNIESVHVERTQDMNDVVLRQIGSGQPSALMAGKVDFVWKTIVPEAQMQSGPIQSAGM